jgi:arginine:ornithine antiporter/lysine permease
MLALVFQTLFCRKPDLFKPIEAALFAAIAIAACAGIYALAAGAISI